MINKDFLRQVFVEKKLLLALDEVQWVTVPKYDELSVSNVMETLKHDENLLLYLPDNMPKGKTPDREYFFNVLNTLYPEYVQKMIKKSQENRMSAASSAHEDGVVHVSDEWWKKLNANPYFSCKYMN